MLKTTNQLNVKDMCLPSYKAKAGSSIT